ncbi:MAG: heavy-metal-associated domain-containing protein [Verrucomicrobia bacterium]|nr:heavy-metal-associated domain-containing protein [Verrucomicrobiota bacterium]
MKRLLTASFVPVLLALAAAGCFRQNVVSRNFTVPAMKTPECAAIIQDALSGVDGYVSSRPYVESRTITVTYNSRTVAGKNIELTIARAGFDVDDRGADQTARDKLPKACQ